MFDFSVEKNKLSVEKAMWEDPDYFNWQRKLSGQLCETHLRELDLPLVDR